MAGGYISDVWGEREECMFSIWVSRTNNNFVGDIFEGYFLQDTIELGKQMQESMQIKS